MNRIFALSIAVLLTLSACVFGSRVEQPPTPQPASTPTQPGLVVQEPAGAPGPEWVAYIGLDGNVWLADAVSGARQQVTQNGTPRVEIGLTPTWTEYRSLTWSSDGTLLAFRSLTRTDNGTSMEFEGTLWLYQAASGELRPLVRNDRPNVLAFRPGTHLLAYDEGLDITYFTNGQINADMARGIMGLDVDTGETSVLVPPEHGFWLSEPRWSPDGRFLGFVEQTAHEEPLPFGLYDFENRVYGAWNQAIGHFDFAPGGQQIAYDRLVSYQYTPDNQRIWVSDLWGKDEYVFSPANGPVARNPAWSPAGDRLAYIFGDPGAIYLPIRAEDANVVVVQPLGGGETLRLGSFAYISSLAWSSDGTRLAFSNGPYDYMRLLPLSEPVIKVITVADGSVTDLAHGFDPAWQPSPGQ